MPCSGGVYVPPSSSDKVIGSLGMYNIKYSWVYERTSRWFLDCTSASNMNIISHLGKCFKTFETPMMCISKWIQYGCDDGDLSFNDFCVSSMYQSLTLSKTQDELCRKASRSLEIAAAVVEEVHEMATNIYKVDMLAGWTCEQWEAEGGKKCHNAPWRNTCEMESWEHPQIIHIRSYHIFVTPNILTDC